MDFITVEQKVIDLTLNLKSNKLFREIKIKVHVKSIVLEIDGTYRDNLKSITFEG